jgi:hypothetical protein
MFCSNCGNVVDEGVAFCISCGSKVENTQTVSTVSVSSAKEESYTGKKGFFASLFDFSFTKFITTKIIKLLYGLGVVVSILGAGVAILLPVFKGYSSEGGKILALILFPLLALLGIIIIRVWLEIIIVMFRIAEHTGEIAMQGRRKS